LYVIHHDLQASEYQTSIVVEVLLAHEAGPNAKDEIGMTPLMQVPLLETVS
jgi:hypothetical protein